MSLKNQLTENVKLLQKAAIIRQNDGVAEVLLLLRSSDSLSRPSCWDLPGGNSEWPVSQQVSAANLHLADISREILEETSLKVSENIFGLSKLVHFSTYFDRQKEVFTIICGWLIEFALTDQKEIQISNEHQKYAWVVEDDLVNYDFGGDKGTFILNTIQKAFVAFRNRS